MTDFAKAWSLHRRGYNPIGYELKYAGAPNWVRFHSLPTSKRYADTDEERAVLLERQNTLAAKVLGEGPCWIAQSHWPQPSVYERDFFRAARELGLDHALEFLPLTTEGGEWSVHARLTTWPASASRDLLLSIADDQAAPTIWMSDADGAVFAPYDGGVDLFLPTTKAMLDLKRAHPDWLSSHPAGL